MIVLNALGDTCPIPVIKAKKALKDMNQNDTLVVSVDNVIATENLAKMAKELGYESSLNVVNDNHYEVTIVKGEDKAISVSEPLNAQTSGTYVIAVGANTMGEGAEELGKTLLKGFLFAVTELENLPETMLFYNSGAKMTIDGSPALEDLKKLEESGVEILTCGTCLNYYGIAEKLAVGTVTNMYSILEKLSGASKIIKP